MVGEYRIRPLNAEEMDLPIQWARQEGWNPGLRDGECFHTADPEGFMVAELDGQPVGTISAVRYDDTFGFIGFYIVKEGERDHGYGTPLLLAAMKRLNGCNVGLDGVLERVEGYRRLGATLAFQTMRYEGVGGGSTPPGLQPLGSLPFEQVTAYDRQCFPAPRQIFLKKWIHQAGATSLAFCEGGDLKGYGVIRPCFHGHKIGPLFADTAEIAENLFQGLSAVVPGQPLFLDIPEHNQEAVLLVNRHRMNPGFCCGRMYSQGEPDIQLKKVFGGTSLEIG